MRFNGFFPTQVRKNFAIYYAIEKISCAPALRHECSTVTEKTQLPDKIIKIMLFRAHYTGKFLLGIIGWTPNPVAHSFHMEEEGAVRVPCFTV